MMQDHNTTVVGSPSAMTRLSEKAHQDSECYQGDYARLTKVTLAYAPSIAFRKS